MSWRLGRVRLHAVVATSLASTEPPAAAMSLPRRPVFGARRSPRRRRDVVSSSRRRRETSRPRHRRETSRRRRRRRRLGPLRPAHGIRCRGRACDYGGRVRRHGRLPGDGPRGGLAAERRRVAASRRVAVTRKVQAHLSVVRRRRGRRERGAEVLRKIRQAPLRCCQSAGRSQGRERLPAEGPGARHKGFR